MLILGKGKRLLLDSLGYFACVLRGTFVDALVQCLIRLLMMLGDVFLVMLLCCFSSAIGSIKTDGGMSTKLFLGG